MHKFITTVVMIIVFSLVLFPTTAAYSQELVIEYIEITGYGELAEDKLYEVINVSVGDTVVEDRIREDMQDLYELGYFSDVEAKTEPYNDGVRLIYHLISYPELSEVEFMGNEVVDDQKLLSLLALELNKPLNYLQLGEGLDDIRDYYSDQGFVLADIYEIDFDQDSNKLNIDLREGIIDLVEIRGNHKTREFVIERELNQEPGDAFNLGIAREDQRKIFNLGFFEDVYFDLEPVVDKPGRVKMILEVEEQKTGNVNLGAGYSSRDGLIGHIEASEKNLLGRGQEVDLSFQFGEKTSYEFGFYEPWLDQNQTSLGLDLYNTLVNLTEQVDPDRYEDIDDIDYDEINYDQRSRGILLSLGRPTGEYSRTYLRGKYEGTDIYVLEPEDPDEEIIEDIKGNVTRSLSLSNITDTRDNIFAPSSGRRDQFTVEYAGQILGGDYDFTKYDLDMRRFMEGLNSDHTLALRLKGGMSSSLDGLPRHELYTLGGSETLRGYEDHQFSGDRFMLFNTEYRINLLDNIDGALFFDMGNTWDHDQDVNLGDNYKSYGLGVRFNTPIGQLRLDYGIASDQEDERDNRRLHFSLGQTF